MSDTVDVDALRQEWQGVEFETREFVVDPDVMVGWAKACGETDPRFIDRDHPDFQASVNLTTNFHSGKVLPKGFPKIGKFGIDGGKSVEALAPVRAGDTLTGKATIADIFDKTGRSGTMVFVVQRMSFSNQNGDPVSVVDWKMIRGL